jgi:hypothetical protein
MTNDKDHDRPERGTIEAADGDAHQPASDQTAPAPATDAGRMKPTADDSAPQSVQAARSEAASPSVRPTAEPATTGQLPALVERELLRSFPQLDHLRLIELEAGEESGKHRVALGRLVRQLNDEAQQELCLALAGAAAERGLTVLPVLIPYTAWETLEAEAAAESWTGCLQPQSGTLRQLQLVLERQPQPRAVRRWLLRLLRERSALLSAVKNLSELPPHTALQLCATVAADALKLSFALGGEAFVADASAVANARRLADKMPLGADDVQTYLALLGQLELARLAERLFSDPRSIAPDPQQSITLVERMLSRLNTYARTVLMSDKERRSSRIARFWIGAGASALAVAGLISYLLSLAPREPLKDIAPIRNPGGISGEYYSGAEFNQMVFKRHDSRIRLGTRGSNDPRLGHERFSVRWRGYLRFQHSGRHALCTMSDDGARVYLDGELVIDDWATHSPRRSCAEVRVEAGWFPLVVEYHQGRGARVMQLLVGPNKHKTGLVRATDLCCRKPLQP